MPALPVMKRWISVFQMKNPMFMLLFLFGGYRLHRLIFDGHGDVEVLCLLYGTFQLVPWRLVSPSRIFEAFVTFVSLQFSRVLHVFLWFVCTSLWLQCAFPVFVHSLVRSFWRWQSGEWCRPKRFQAGPILSWDRMLSFAIRGQLHCKEDGSHKYMCLAKVMPILQNKLCPHM